MTARFDETSFLFGANGAFIEGLYARFIEEPNAVPAEWRAFFASLGDDPKAVLEELEFRLPPPGESDEELDEANGANGNARPAPRARPAHEALSTEQVRQETLYSIRALMMIRAYRVRGHLIADLDPLQLEGEKHHPELDPASYGFAEADYDRPIFVDGVLGLEFATLRELLDVLKQTYCSTVGVEFMHIQYPEQKAWLQQRFENTRNKPALDLDDKHDILRQLDAAEAFERFLQLKYLGHKRFSLEGAESVIPAMEAIIETGSDLGIEDIVIGMPHRGRLNVLTTIMDKSYEAMFSEFEGESAYPDDVQGSGDVKYHLGSSADRTLPNGKTIHLSLTANPSHLEAVNPVVEGKTRAKQGLRGDTERKQVMALLLHGDAAFSGQGVVAETFHLSELRGYRTGGTIHIIVNNQIGFTTSPGYSRSSPYPSDVAKIVQAPILHVNGDDPEAVVHVARIATEFRQTFGKDIVIDLFCYRRHGHNEGDEPKFTQPQMYRRIEEQPTTRQIYTERLVASGELKVRDADRMVVEFHARLEQALEASKGYKPEKAPWREGTWEGIAIDAPDRRGDTGAALEILREVGLAIARPPADFQTHPKILRQLDAKRKMIESGENIDWATAEALAFGNLLAEGHNVRLSGQDSARGTFSQRHSVLIDQTSEERYVPLNHIREGQALYEVHDSLLSEAAVLGFEYGYASTEPNSLTIWEAQFGDFANGAQVIIDQFIAPGESKWLRLNDLVMLLPHGYEGQGPEHSSARLERYLQLFAEDNIQVANCTTPANYFHLLRRQLHRAFRKPLIVMTPKSLLRHKLCLSRLDEMGPGTSFHRVIPDSAAPVEDEDIRRVVLCSGKVYYDLLRRVRDEQINDIALVRIEQLAPFPVGPLTRELIRYPGAEIVWCQEEPHNMGAWTFVADRLEAIYDQIGRNGLRAHYVGRREKASPASGTVTKFQQQQDALIDEALAR